MVLLLSRVFHSTRQPYWCRQNCCGKKNRHPAVSSIRENLVRYLPNNNGTFIRTVKPIKSFLSCFFSSRITAFIIRSHAIHQTRVFNSVTCMPDVREFKMPTTNNGYRVRLKACFRIALTEADNIYISPDSQSILFTL